MNTPKNSSTTTPRPQDDLYRFVNAAWLAQTEIPDDQGAWGNFHELLERVEHQLHDIVDELCERENIAEGSIEQKVRDFYLSGMDEQAAAVNGERIIADMFTEIDACTNLADIYTYLGRAQRRGITGIWSVMVEPDEQESDIYRLRLHQDGLSLPDRDYYDENQATMQPIQDKLRAHIQTMLARVDGASVSAAAGESIYTLEKQFADISRSQVALRDVEKNYNKLSYKRLCRLTPIDWEAYFTGLGIAPPKQIIVGQPEFIEAVGRILADTDLTVLQEYLKWHALADVARFLSEETAQAQFDFYGRLLQGAKAMRPRWKRVLSIVDSDIGEALGRLYVQKHFPQAAKQQVEEMVEYLKQAFAERIQQLDWMEEDAKAHAVKKLDGILVKIGYPDNWLEYEELTLSSDSYLGNHLAAEEFHSDFWLRRLEQPVDRKVWLMSPATVNAYFSPTTNEITFPAGILQAPFFDMEASAAANYGGIGVVIGHEITHGFDDQGSMYDAAGNISSWRSQEEQAAFDARAQVMVKQADSYEVLDGQRLQGELTLGENIADVGGLKMAQIALEKMALARDEELDQSDRQEFYINFARIWRQKMRPELMQQLLLTDPHAPGEFRANNSVRNVDGFFAAFDVGQGDGMYLEPSRRVDIW